MIGDACECCGDEVLILLRLHGKQLCLDCFSNYKNDQEFDSNINKNENEENTISSDLKPIPMQHKQRRCTNCGRDIPFDSIICPYCGKKFKDYF